MATTTPPHKTSILIHTAIAAMVVCLVAIAFVVTLHNDACKNSYTTHLKDHVLMSFDAHTLAPKMSVIFHENQMGLYYDMSDTAHEHTTTHPDHTENWHVCRYTWHPHHKQLHIEYLTGPLAPASDTSHKHLPSPSNPIRFTNTTELPQKGLVGYVSYGESSECYLWKAQKDGASNVDLQGRTIVFQPTTSSEHAALPFVSVGLLSRSKALCVQKDSSDHERTVAQDHRMVYKSELPASSKWTCALYLQGRPFSSAPGGAPVPLWKSATVRMCTTKQVADVLWRDWEDIHHKAEQVAFSYDDTPSHGSTT